MAPASAGIRPPTMCTVDRGGFLLTYDLYGVTLDQPSTYTILDMANFQMQVSEYRTYVVKGRWLESLRCVCVCVGGTYSPSGVTLDQLFIYTIL